jgi:osmotically-inducible protein OsmY
MKKSFLFLVMVAAWLLMEMPTSVFAGDDTQDLKSRVETALNPYSMHLLTVSTDKNGVVSITGTVDALYDKLDIYQLVSQVHGVTKIKDLVEVNTPMVPDGMISANVERAIKDNSIILEPDKISVTVTDGIVFLRGTVSYNKEKIMATTISSWQDGVLGVENEINVLSSQEAKKDENIKTVLNEILSNHFSLVQNTVTIKVANGHVSLDGEVQTLWEKEHLKEEFLQVAGVKSVAENLNVKPGY